jgi:hypothetical protein
LTARCSTSASWLATNGAQLGKTVQSAPTIIELKNPRFILTRVALACRICARAKHEVKLIYPLRWANQKK